MAADYDNVANFFVKTYSPMIASVIVDILNKCSRDEVYTNGLKIARAVPVFKSGTRSSQAACSISWFDESPSTAISTALERGCGSNTALAGVINSVQCEMTKEHVKTGIFMINHQTLLFKLKIAGTELHRILFPHKILKLLWKKYALIDCFQYLVGILFQFKLFRKKCRSFTKILSP